MKIHHFLFFSTLLLVLASCQKQNGEPGHDSSALAVRLKPTNTLATLRIAEIGTNPTAKMEGIGLQWTTAQASATMLKFEAERNGAEVEFKSKLQQTVDLFDARAALGNLSITAGTYDEVELKAILSPVSGVPALELNGTLTTASGSTPVSFIANESIEIKGEKKNVAIDGSAIQNADIPLNFVLVTRGVTASEFDNAVRTGGAIVISSSINKDLYAKLVKNLRELKEESEFHK